MARVIGRTQTRAVYGSQMKISEAAIFIAIAIGIIVAARWYFVVYRHSPGVALGNYLGAIKAGEAKQQYDLIDDSDKQAVPTEKDYEKLQMAEGYVERITNIDLAEPVPDPKDPNVVTIKATVSVRAPSQGKQLYDAGSNQTAVDTYTLHKGKDGEWKVVLSQSPMTNLLKNTPNAPGGSF